MKSKIYELIGRAVEKVVILIGIAILALPIISYFFKGNMNLFFYLFGFLIGSFICFFTSKFILYIINRMEKK